jgi:hypothetical protein
MIGLKGMGYVTLGSVLLAAVIFAWYAFVAPLINLDFTNEVYQLAAAFIGVIICFAAYALSKPDF